MGAWIFKRTSGGDCFSEFMSADGATNNRRPTSLETNAGNPFTLQSVANFSTQLGAWNSNGSIALSARAHVVVVYDMSSTLNDPVFYINGAVSGTTETITPSGSALNTDTDTIKFGERSGGASDYDGQIQDYFVHTGLFTADEVNRAMWWGRPIGGMLVYFPFVTTKLANDGSQSASLTATGTTVTGFATPVVRPGTAMMGMGVGW